MKKISYLIAMCLLLPACEAKKKPEPPRSMLQLTRDLRQYVCFECEDNCDTKVQKYANLIKARAKDKIPKSQWVELARNAKDAQTCTATVKWVTLAKALKVQFCDECKGPNCLKIFVEVMKRVGKKVRGVVLPPSHKKKFEDFMWEALQCAKREAASK